MCAPHANCESHQRFFQKDTTTALFKTFIQLHPLRRGEMTTHNTVQQCCSTTNNLDVFACMLHLFQALLLSTCSGNYALILPPNLH